MITSSNASVPTVSVMVITYNHARYIAQTLQSVLDQETTFPVEINVIDDCSTDGAQDIIRDFHARYPGRINLFLNEKNIGYKVTQKNFYYGFRTLTGKYIAILEGDDYWSSPHKLQKQVDFLEANRDYVAASHLVMKTYEDGVTEPHIFLPPPEGKIDHDIYDLISTHSFFHTTTLLYRNVLKDKPPRQFRNKASCDVFVTIAHAQFGRIRFVPEAMSVYRSHPAGRFSTKTQTGGWMMNIDGMRKYNAWLRYRYFKAFAGVIYRYSGWLLLHGTQEEGLTRGKRIKYRLLMIWYRALYDLADQKRLGALRPGRLLRPFTS